MKPFTKCLILFAFVSIFDRQGLALEWEPLFDGKGLEEWVSASGENEISWLIEDGVFTVSPGAGNILTKRSFRDFDLYLEFKIPSEPEKTGQDRGNSGIFLLGLYEIQILDSHNNPTFFAGSCGSLYKQFNPIAEVAQPAESWQRFTISFVAPRIDANGNLKVAGSLSLNHNDIPVLVNVPITRPTGSRGRSPLRNYGPIEIQDHGSAVSFRNILIRLRG